MIAWVLISIQLVSPEVIPLGLKNVYLASQSQSPRQPFRIRLSLQGADGEPILEPQPVWAEVLLPDGTLTQIPLASETRPDENGVYTLSFDLPSIYPYVGNEFARFVFVLHAGSAGERILDAIPIATARLLVDIGPSPFIQLLNPAKIECSADVTPKLQVSIGDAQSVISGTLTAVVSGPAGDITLSGQDGELRGDLTGLCLALISQLDCDAQSQETFTLKVAALLPEDHPFPGVERAIPVQVTAPRCTPAAPTQAESAFVLPTPTTHACAGFGSGWVLRSRRCLPDEIRVKPFPGLPAAYLDLGSWRTLVVCPDGFLSDLCLAALSLFAISRRRRMCTLQCVCAILPRWM